jgi:branched-subunit amino acid aminotransferase/4-amino-4-deoxychorismate lyase
MLILNGRPIQANAPELSLLNRSFKYGDGLFESLRLFEGKVLFWEDHLQRLFTGMKRLKFQFEPEAFQQTLQDALHKLLSINQLDGAGRLRMHVYRAGGGAYLPLEHRPFYLLEGYALKSEPYESHLPLSLTDYTDLSLHFDLLSGIKTANSLPYVMAAQHAREQGFDEALLYCGAYVSEASAANLFVVKNKKVYTPPLAHACLDGVMRKQVFRLCQELKIPIQEKGIKAKELSQADELFLTNTIRGIVGVRQYQDWQFDTRRAGITSLLRRSLFQLASRG